MRANELRARSSQLEAAQVKGGHLEENLRLQRKKTEKMAMELEASKERLSKAEQGLKESLATNQAKAIENNEMSVELRKIDAEVAQLYQEQLRQVSSNTTLPSLTTPHSPSLHSPSLTHYPSLTIPH